MDFAQGWEEGAMQFDGKIEETEISKTEIEGRKVTVSKGDNGLVFLETEVPQHVALELTRKHGLNSEDLEDIELSIECLDMLPGQADELGFDLVNAAGRQADRKAEALERVLQILDQGEDAHRLQVARDQVVTVLVSVLKGGGTNGDYSDAQCVLHGAIKRLIGE